MNRIIMNSPRKIVVACLLAFMLGLAGPAAAETPGDPIVRLDNNTKIELDMGLMVREMMPLLMNALSDEDEEAAMMLGMLQELVGMEALDTLKMESKSTRDHAFTKMTLTLDPEMKDSLLFRMYTVENGKCEFSRYVKKDDLVMFTTVHNFPAYLNLMLDVLAMPELAEFTGDMPVNENGELALGDFVPRTDLLPLLSGELDFFILDAPGEAAPSPLAAPIVLVLGSTDGFALKAQILNIAAMLGGEAGMGIGEMIAAVEPEMVGDFELQELPMGGALAVSEDYLVISMVPGELREMLAAKKGDLKVPSGLEWVYLNGPKYGAYMDSAMDMAGMMGAQGGSETEWMMKFYAVLFDHIETEEVLYKSTANGMIVTAEVDGPVQTGMYRMLYAVLEELPAIIEQEKLKNGDSEALQASRNAIGELDSALTGYGMDNGGIFPEDPRLLVDLGYLDYFPLTEATPAGQYIEGGYTYHVLRNEAGAVDGYLLFAYAGGEGTGFDVYTPENLAAEGNFQISRDGIPDGVASYCYDGTAMEQVNQYNNR